MDLNPEIKKRIDKVLNSQRIAVLGTSKDGEPYSCLVGFALTEDLKELVFATMRERLKYRQMEANPRVTLMIDDRDVQNSDFNDTTSLTIVGSATDITGSDRERYASLLLKQHPVLTEFVRAPDCAVMRVSVDKIYVVSEFESVVKIGI
ncbi:MAG: pyridoxamine 5'-phosphate oxidase family protein [Candidatus Thorarchaeota archaeon]|jgi:nitroimidazol reductase NimA-like FMN-containing flavoprotein (pyridoxamine 5'-phosphate oxidase superfamily)